MDNLNKVKIYHNPRCRKSREALNFLEEKKKEKGFELEIIDYLKKGLKKEEILDIKNKLGLNISDFIRKNEIEFKEFKKKNTNYDEEDLIILLEKSPKILQRPIIIFKDKAFIGREKEVLEKIFN